MVLGFSTVQITMTIFPFASLASMTLCASDPERLDLDHRMLGLRLGNLPDLQHVRPAEFFPENGSHETSLP